MWSPEARAQQGEGEGTEEEPAETGDGQVKCVGVVGGATHTNALFIIHLHHNECQRFAASVLPCDTKELGHMHLTLALGLWHWGPDTPSQHVAPFPAGTSGRLLTTCPELFRCGLGRGYQDRVDACGDL